MKIEREKALNRVQMYQFALIEANLFLDTHPTDQQALEYYKNTKQLYSAAVKDYVAQYGPLAMGDISDDATEWEWIKGPWPWEGEK